MAESIHLKYLVTSPEDKVRGLIISSVGTQGIAPHEPYPPRKHPTRYHFSPEQGRILDEYQLLYIIKGSGTFTSSSTETTVVNEGDMFLLFPGQWHSYHPDKDTGWTELWIGFTGEIIDSWKTNGIVSQQHQIFHVGIMEELVGLYKQAMNAADAQESGYQQMLCGIVCHLLSSCLYYDRNAAYRSDRVQDTISKVRSYISDNVNSATPESAAAHVSVGYSKMRKLFKQYTGLTLGQYIAEVRTNKAKNLLSNTDMPIGEIAGMLGFDNEEYFSTSFKRITNEQPTAYRKRMQQA